MSKPEKLKFIDLFAGLGGFHLALEELGHECVFASEINSELRELYKLNHGIDCSGDINAIETELIPGHDILCAGFPCQPFSKAGKREGLEDLQNGNFFDRIMDIVNFHSPEYIFLENVPNLKGHDNGYSWKYIYESLSKNYEVDEQIISPHEFEIPQHRTRIYIVGRLRSKGGLSHFDFPKPTTGDDLSIHSIIEKSPESSRELRSESIEHLSIWQEFLDYLEDDEVPRFPVWAMEFGATYPYEGKAPIKHTNIELRKFKGKFGRPIIGQTKGALMQQLPNYAQTDQQEFPRWKKNYIRLNREFYEKHKDWLKGWLKKVENFENSHLKFEWNCGKGASLVIENKIVQFRPSGIRVKKPNYSPALVLTATQIPIFPWLNRYMTVREATRLQCMDKLKHFPSTESKSFRAFGNAVNVCIVQLIAKNLISNE